MAICKDCVHYGVCRFSVGVDEPVDLYAFHYGSEEMDIYNRAEYNCSDFKDKNNLVELPCKIGDIVYGVVWWDNETKYRIVTAEVKSFDIGDYGLVVDTYPNKEDGRPLSFGEIGKWVFLTKEDAQKEIQRQKERDKEEAFTRGEAKGK